MDYFVIAASVKTENAAETTRDNAKNFISWRAKRKITNEKKKKMKKKEKWNLNGSGWSNDVSPLLYSPLLLFHHHDSMFLITSTFFNCVPVFFFIYSSLGPCLKQPDSQSKSN